jgi:hypothetical protein
MKSKTAIFKISVILACFFFILGVKNSFSEEPDPDTTEDKIETARIAHEQALKNHEARKQKEQDELLIKLNSRLEQVITTWTEAAKKEKEAKMDTRLEQQWEKLSHTFPISPAPYQYNLRGYNYSVIKNDVSKTDSMTSPYKALVIIKEDLYVEKNHSSDISDINPYFYTVSTNYTLNFEYKNDKFNLVNSDNKIVSIENNCPREIKRKRL